jgi:HlyD family secretion protein
MRTKIIINVVIPIMFFAVSCNNKNEKSDAFGNFEATETVISAEIAGKITDLKIEEGQILDSGIIVCQSDTSALFLQKQLILSQKIASESKFSDIVAQVNVLEEQKKVSITEKNRLIKLMKDSAATQKQLDDIDGKINIVDKQIDQVKNQNKNLFDQLKTFDAQIKIADDQISKTKIKNPFKGTVLTKYVEVYEMLLPGKPIYKIADCRNMILRVYISGSQISDLKIGQKVRVFFDKTEIENQEIFGIVEWISDKAEFTPKIIQTKEERVNFVYAVKIRVKNDGKIKIGMPGEVKF